MPHIYKKWFSYCLFTQFIANPTLAERAGKLSDREIAYDILNTMLNDSYNHNLRPAGNDNDANAPTIVNMGINLNTIDFIDDVRMEFGAQAILRQSWYDGRLKFGNHSRHTGKLEHVTLRDRSRIWFPDTFIQNERRVRIQEFLSQNTGLWIYPNGTVRFSVRLTMVIRCPMDLRRYPFDNPDCSIGIESYYHTADDMILKWATVSPVTIPGELNLARFELVKHTTTSYAGGGVSQFSRLEWTLYFKRNITFYVIQVYIPSSMLVGISWVGFWLDETAKDARVSLGVTVILTLVTQTYGINQASPPASYVKALDVWTSACQIFVVAAFLEFAFVNYFHSAKKKDDGPRKAARNIIFSSNFEENAPQFFKTANLIPKSTSRAKRIDLISRVIFPFCFFAFVSIYWAVYLNSY